MAKKSTRKSKAGRPPGRPNDPPAVVETIHAACPSCQSTDKERIRIINEQAHAGLSPAGHERTHIVWRRCRCKSCERYYVEISHENRS